MAGAEGEKGSSSEIDLPYTPTWIVATLCSIIVLISVIFERLIHRGGKVCLLVILLACNSTRVILELGDYILDGVQSKRNFKD